MGVEFTAHNIRLDDGTLTMPAAGAPLESHPWAISAKRMLEIMFPGDKSRYRVADLGCLEGGYAVIFARMGFQVLGIEVRQSNLAACRFVQSRTSLPNLDFACDDAWNVAKYGSFDAVFCCGLLYHLDRPRKFLELLSAVTKKLVILQTHFATADRGGGDGRLRRFLRRIINPVGKAGTSADKYRLTRLTENESLHGRWFTEFASEAQFRDRENFKGSSWDNRRSFWVQREYLLQAIHDAGFDTVMEQFDGLGSQIAESMLRGFYHTDSRGTFLGIKTSCGEKPLSPPSEHSQTLSRPGLAT
jgi:hypothetical protein